MTQYELLADCLRRLNAGGLEYMVTGSMASNFWGMPRSTHDVDLVVRLDAAAVPVVIEAFHEGFFLQPDAVRSALRPPFQFNAIDERSPFKVDFWVLRDDAFERNMFSRRRRVEVRGQPAWMAAPEDVILHKLRWNQQTPSERQLSDAAGIVAVQGQTLDRDYMTHWAAQLGVSDTLNDLLTGKIKPKNT